MRLIDADKFKEQVAGACIKNGFGKSVEKASVMLELIDLQPTLNEKEIIRKAFERVVERLEEMRDEFDDEWLRTLSASAYQGRETIDMVK